MVILKYELRRHRTYILGWAIALAACIFFMTPTYYSFLDAASVELFETMGTTDFYRSVGVSMEYLTSPLGIYGFLTSFFMIASGVFGMHFGISRLRRQAHYSKCRGRMATEIVICPRSGWFFTSGIAPCTSQTRQTCDTICRLPEERCQSLPLEGKVPQFANWGG